VLAVRGGGRSQDTAKKTGQLTWREDSEGRRCLGRYDIGDGHGWGGVTRENATGQDMERNRATETNSPATVPVARCDTEWVWHRRRGQRGLVGPRKESEPGRDTCALEGAGQDGFGHRKKKET